MDNISKEVADNIGNALCSLPNRELTRHAIYDILYNHLSLDEDDRVKCHKCMRRTFTTIKVSGEWSEEEIFYCPECYKEL